MSDAELQRVEAALDTLLADNDPSTQSYEEFRGHQFDQGLAWVMYPEGHGGLGVRPSCRRSSTSACMRQEHPDGRIDVLHRPGGSTILTHGSEEVKQRFLRPMFTGEEKWCQLFSNPAPAPTLPVSAPRRSRTVTNGSSTARRCGTLAHIADFGMLVTRTDPNVPKHRRHDLFRPRHEGPGC